jgi:CRP-like cAMP-binding protein
MAGEARVGGPTENHLLATLPMHEYHRLLTNVDRVLFSLGEVVYETAGRLEYVYFPVNCVVSLLYTTEDGCTAEMGLTGNDGMVGLALFLGGDTTPNRAVVQIAGDALRMKAKVLQEEFALGGPFQHLLLRYTQALITQISQTAICNRLHSVEKRLCRWLLLCQDRVNSDELRMTQEFISNMLGGRRESVTISAGRLQDAGLIRYSRGHIEIVSRTGLEAAACECYQVVKDEFDRLLRKRSDPSLESRSAVVQNTANKKS